MLTRETVIELKEAARACGDADRLAKAADCLASFGVKYDLKGVQRRLECMAIDERKIAKAVKALDGIDYWHCATGVRDTQQHLERIRIELLGSCNN